MDTNHVHHRTTFRGSLLEGRDAERIDRLAAVSAGPAPEGPLLLAEVDGEPVAATGLFDRRMIADPASADLALRVRLRLLRLQVRLIVAVHGI